jgi:hypothetical protein
MIKDYTNFILEALGDGKQEFTEKLDMYRGSRNLGFYGAPHTYGEIDDVTGIIKYRVEVDYDRSAITSITFEPIEISLEISTTKYKGPDDDDGEKEEFEIVFNKFDEDNVAVEVNKLPYYLKNLSIDMSDCEDIDGEVDLSKATFDLEFGNNE